MEFRNAANQAFGTELPATIVFDYPTPRELAEFLLKISERNFGGGGERLEALPATEVHGPHLVYLLGISSLLPQSNSTMLSEDASTGGSLTIQPNNKQGFKQ